MGESIIQDQNDPLQTHLQNLSIQEEPERSAFDLLKQCESLLGELEQFQQYLVERKQDTEVELRHFRSGVKAEFKLIQKLSRANHPAERTAHTLRSSNFPFYAAVWDAAKQCTGIKALDKRFYWNPAHHATQNAPGGAATASGARSKRHSAIVDVVAQDGLEWVKVSTVTEKRILFDMAKAGWVADSSSDDSDNGFESMDVDDDEPEGLLKQAKALFKASKSTRVHYQHPTVRIILPRIHSRCSKVVEDLLSNIRALGIKVQTADEIPISTPISVEVLSRLVVNPFAGFSDTINVDCTILLAFVSDLSYSRVEKEDWHHRAVLRQIEMEMHNPLLPNSLWPACGSKPLVCTREAAVRMQEIVDLIGTESEKKRTDCLMENTKYPSPAVRLDTLQDLSDYAVPRSWQLPIFIIDVDVPAMKAHLPPIVEDLSRELSPINQSVFFYGWAFKRTTISSNRTVAKEIEATVEKSITEGNIMGPTIWISPASRSLVGKEKTRRDWNS